MAYPVLPIRRSALLNGKTNGNLPASILRTAGTATLITPASRGWVAMRAAAARDGVLLNAVDSYRSYARQRAMFLERYTTQYRPFTSSKVWLGRRWYKLPGVAVAAVPGTSNHGWGAAVDVGNMTTARTSWLVAHERAFGWSHEIQSERWHVVWWSGDAIPAAVLAYEHGTPAPAPAPPQEEDDVRLIIKGDKSDQWWATDGIQKDHIESPQMAAAFAYGGLVKNATPIVWPQSWVDSIPIAGTGVPFEQAVQRAVQSLLATDPATDAALKAKFVAQTKALDETRWGVLDETNGLRAMVARIAAKLGA